MATHNRRYVIERASESKREWWTGSGWSEDQDGARWYETEPDAASETEDESAEAVEYAVGMIDE